MAVAARGDVSGGDALRTTPANLHHGRVDDDAVAVLFETLFDIKIAVYDIRDELLGGSDEEEEDDA